MKILALATMFISLSSFASANRVGDEAMLVGNYNGQQVVLKSQITKYVPNEAKYIVKNTTTVPGQGTFSEEVLVTEDEIMTPEKAQLILLMCPQVGGVVEEL